MNGFRHFCGDTSSTGSVSAAFDKVLADSDSVLLILYSRQCCDLLSGTFLADRHNCRNSSGLAREGHAVHARPAAIILPAHIVLAAARAGSSLQADKGCEGAEAAGQEELLCALLLHERYMKFSASCSWQAPTLAGGTDVKLLAWHLSSPYSSHRARGSDELCALAWTYRKATCFGAAAAHSAEPGRGGQWTDIGLWSRPGRGPPRVP